MDKFTQKDALSILRELKQAENRKLYPNVPEHALPRPKYSDKTANELTRAITDYIRLNGGYCTRINTTGQFRGGKWVKGTTSKGTADLHAAISGRHVSIEVKIGRDKLSPAQIKQAGIIERAGGLYYVARNFSDFFDWLNTLNNGRE
jgi:hypothetical protein